MVFGSVYQVTLVPWYLYLLHPCIFIYSTTTIILLIVVLSLAVHATVALVNYAACLHQYTLTSLGTPVCTASVLYTTYVVYRCVGSGVTSRLGDI